MALAGCLPADPAALSPAGPSNGASHGPEGALPIGLILADGHGWSPGGLYGPMPAPASCHVQQGVQGQPLPDPQCTPGAVDAAVTASNVDATVCRTGGYTGSVRPPQRLTDQAKAGLLAAYGIPVSQASRYELDHLVELNAGGASDLRNLWPEPNTFEWYAGSAFIHNDKDAIERYTFDAICRHAVSVTAVQQAMATDWTTAVSTLGLPPLPDSYRH
jgi:hypothetical protein